VGDLRNETGQQSSRFNSGEQLLYLRILILRKLTTTHEYRSVLPNGDNLSTYQISADLQKGRRMADYAIRRPGLYCRSTRT
jgi:hypothetical protein